MICFGYTILLLQNYALQDIVNALKNWQKNTQSNATNVIRAIRSTFI